MLRNFENEVYDVIILAGQSNAEGRGIGSVEKAYKPSDKIWSMNCSFTPLEYTISPDEEKVFENEIRSNFALSFAKEYVRDGRLAEGRKLLIVRAAVSATGFVDNRWKCTDDLYQNMISMAKTALSLNPQNRLVAMLWHQGEADIWARIPYETHFDNLMTLVRSSRAELNAPDLPFIAADIVPKWKASFLDISLPVINAIKDVCKDCGNGAFVETDGLLSNAQEFKQNPWNNGECKDGIHFSRRSLYELGKRYYQAFVKIGEANKNQ
ncbi:MAG: hypothetical protein J6B09_01585 [Clostridia bacterium]|nr:hypothetical protein [Clostridia bacterium]